MAFQLAAPPSGASSPSRPVSVLIVDDTEDLRFILRRVLSGTGRFHVAGEATNGREALEVAARVQPDVILLDLLMPVMDGWEALPLLRRACPKSRVVVVSGQDRSHAEARALALGASGYIEKGVSSAEIVRALQRIIDTPRSSS
jgi:CheY-like chemotaxis protein